MTFWSRLNTSIMNMNRGNDPMLSSFINDDWVKFHGTSSTTASPAPTLVIPQPLPSSFLHTTDGLLSPEHNSEFSDLSALWSNERKRVLSIKMEDEDSSYSVAGDADTGDVDMEETDIGSNTTVNNIKSEIEDNDCGDIAEVSSQEIQDYKYDTNKFQMTEVKARRYVEEQFEKIAFVPRSDLSQREKISFILSKSDCTEFSIENILNFDKKCLDSARACAKIVQNIPQRYRWECVTPEEIPCCYTIVADCKKVSSRDKPPRPMNAFMIWAQSARRLINELCPKMQNALISEALGYYWRQKSDSFKQRFEQEKMKLRRYHNVEFPEYKYRPKTKVQKAKEKQELSLSKAKMRASVKLEKLRRTEASNLRRSNTKCGRPKKTKTDTVQKGVNELPSPQVVICEKSARRSPTKPGIKDMLTLKILNDRRCKEATSVISKSQQLVRIALGQMSPIEMDRPGMGDTVEELGNIDTTAHLDKDVCSKANPSSVFDTPANTPPVDEDDDERHHSPVHPHQASPTSSFTESASRTSCSLSTNNQHFITSLPTVQILPVKTMNDVQGVRGLSLLDLISKQPATSSNNQLSTTAPDQVLDITDLLLTFVTESLSAAQQNTDPVTSKKTNRSSISIDANNNYDNGMSNNFLSDVNNNNIDLPTSSAASSTNSKPILSLNEPNDLDTLFLDLNVPILSDDDLRSILNTL